MTITAAAALVAALLSTIITAIAVQAHWTPTQKRVASGVVSLLLAGMVALASDQLGEWVPRDWVAWAAKWLIIAGGVAAWAQGLYAQFKGILSKLEDATTIGGVPDVPPAEIPAADETPDELPAEDGAEPVADDYTPEHAEDADA